MVVYPTPDAEWLVEGAVDRGAGVVWRHTLAYPNVPLPSLDLWEHTALSCYNHNVNLQVFTIHWY